MQNPQRSPTFVELSVVDTHNVAAELRAGLLQRQASVSPKFLYDALGSRLFEAITELPEYYPTRTEASIFAAQAREMATAIRPGATLVDLGAGNCEKASRLFEPLQPSSYVAVDISVEFLRRALQALQRQFPQLPMTGVGLDFSKSLALPADLLPGRTVFFYPGSSIGNFTPDEALAFLRQVRRLAGTSGGLLIGVDRVKPREILEPAYDDALGITSGFNLNLLLHLNRLLEADFRLPDWQHVALWNERQSRVEMHLEARRDVQVRWNDGGERRFAAGERIHTENSYKYRVGDIDALLRDAGFARTRHWTDERAWFSVVYATA